MNHTEAIAILNRHLESLEALGYAALARQIGEDQAFEVRGDSGSDYQLEVSILWDRHPNGSIRIVGSIDDGEIQARVLPLTDSRLMKPEGS